MSGTHKVGGTGERDRRYAQRFPIQMDVRYRAPNRSVFGYGRSINIRSRAVLISTRKKLLPEQILEVALDWPVRLENGVSLQLVIQGAVIRSTTRRAVVSIERFEFRTARKRASSDKGKPEASSVSKRAG